MSSLSIKTQAAAGVPPESESLAIILTWNSFSTVLSVSVILPAWPDWLNTVVPPIATFVNVRVWFVKLPPVVAWFNTNAVALVTEETKDPACIPFPVTSIPFLILRLLSWDTLVPSS